MSIPLRSILGSLCKVQCNTKRKFVAHGGGRLRHMSYFLQLSNNIKYSTWNSNSNGDKFGRVGEGGPEKMVTNFIFGITLKCTNSPLNEQCHAKIYSDLYYYHAKSMSCGHVVSLF